MNGEGRRVLIVGGYGTFGGRLAQLLGEDERLILLIAGRSKSSADTFCKLFQSRAQMLPCQFDRAGDLAAQLRALKPDLIVDAAGPFQIYGADPYVVVRAAIAQGAHYVDLADGSDFVRNITQFDEVAREKGLFVLSGVSSFPVLHAAVVRALLKPGERPERIETGLAPSPKADLGLNVMRAIASYAGKPVAIIRDGVIGNASALIESRRMAIAPPGMIPLGRKRFSLVDVPDLQLLRQLWPDVRDVWVGAAMSPGWLQRMINFAAMAVRFKVLPSLSFLAPFMLRVRNFLAYGEHRGGMVVRVSGRGETGALFARSWHMIAPGDHGPFIPSMPAAIIIRLWLDGVAPPPGARAALSEMDLDAYEELFSARGIRHGIRDDSASAQTPLYRQVLGDAYAGLPAVLQTMHDRTSDKTVSGIAQIDRGESWLSRIAARITGFPPAGRDVPVTVAFTLRDGVETWTRDFGGHRFHSVQSRGKGRNAGLIDERFGPAAFGLAYEITGGRGVLSLRNWRIFGIPMPLCLAPNSQAFEFTKDGKFNFFVEISHPLTGLIVRYRGWLE